MAETKRALATLLANISDGGSNTAEEVRDFIVSALPAEDPGYINGLITSNGTDASHDIDITVGCATCEDGSGGWLFVDLETAITKQIDAAWAVGTAAGGLDGTESSAGTPDANTWYHVWLIYRSDTGVTDIAFSENATGGPSIDGTPIPTAYDYYRRIGAVLTDGSANIIAYTQYGDEFRFVTGIEDHSGSQTGGAWADETLSVPLGIKVKARIQIDLPGDGNDVALNDPDNADPSSWWLRELLGSGTSDASISMVTEWTNTSRQVSFYVGVTAALKLRTTGWIDPRGRTVT